MDSRPQDFNPSVVEDFVLISCGCGWRRLPAEVQGVGVCRCLCCSGVSTIYQCRLVLSGGNDSNGRALATLWFKVPDGWRRLRFEKGEKWTDTLAQHHSFKQLELAIS